MKYLIVYRLDDEKAYEFEDIPEAIYELDPDATNVFGEVWLIKTTANTAQIKDSLSQHLGPDDRLVVTAAGDTEFVGFDKQATAWMMSGIDE